MYGDTSVIRHLAGRLQAQADGLRSEADALVSRTLTVPWQGSAAEAMRRVARDRAGALRRTAAAHDDAATALLRHATEVEQRQALIAALEHRAARLCSSARDRLAALGRRALDGVAEAVPDPVDELLARFDPPPSGHLAWLRVDLPGLR